MRSACLVDTDWAIHYLRGHAAIIKRVDQVRANGVAVSLFTLAELYEGVQYSRDPQASLRALTQFLRGFSVLGIDIETCKAFALERGHLRVAGRMIGDFDLMIGLTARQNGLTLMTNNRRHFERIEDLRIEFLEK